MRHLIFALVASMASVMADVKLAPPFQDRAVLQRDKPCPVWGSADPGEAIQVTFKGQTKQTTADKDGKWRIQLDPLSVSAEPAEMVASGKNRIVLHDIVVGEVWFCSGQSNMAYLVSRAKNATEEIASGNYPLIREFKVERDVAEAPVEDAKGKWQMATPQTVGEFTAVGYYFARDIFQELSVPVGLINASWGGAYIESWLTPAGLEKDEAGRGAAKRWQGILAKEQPSSEGAPKALSVKLKKEVAGGMFNHMVYPFRQYALRGILWYQGEANTPRARSYQGLFHSLITRWRESFGQGDLPFYWVQLPNFKNSGPDNTERAVLREGQHSALVLPATGQAVTIDIGEAADNHPKNKQDVGKRLALLALTNVYGLKKPYSGPQATRVERDGARMRVFFSHAEGGLMAKSQPLTDFQIAGQDGKFQPATAVIDGETLVVEASNVPEPVVVRYAWRNAPEASLFNQAGLPAAPFRTDKL